LGGSCSLLVYFSEWQPFRRNLHAKGVRIERRKKKEERRVDKNDTNHNTAKGGVHSYPFLYEQVSLL
jgi:hypothetical protein